MYSSAGKRCLFYERDGRLREYILSLIAAAIICAIVACLVSGNTITGKMLRLLSGILMLITAITPLATISFHNISTFFDDINFAADAYVSEGERIANDEFSAIIKGQSEAYILDKATRMGLEIAVEVELDGGNNSIPRQIRITGEISPYEKGLLSEFITDNLGIPKECQQWM